MAIAAMASLSFAGFAHANGATSSASVPTCVQGQLQVAEEAGVEHQPLGSPNGITFLIVNVTSRTCAIKGFPWWIVFSTSGGHTVNATPRHHSNPLFGEPRARRVILDAHSVASFGLSYTYVHAPPRSPSPNCEASLVDFRLPAIFAHLFSFEFPISIDLCAANRQFDVTPVEDRTAPLA